MVGMSIFRDTFAHGSSTSQVSKFVSAPTYVVSCRNAVNVYTSEHCGKSQVQRNSITVAVLHDTTEERDIAVGQHA